MPPKSNSSTRVISYLKSRGIDGGLIEQCIRSGQLYESLPYHNAVFVGMDTSGTPHYACLRGTGTDFKGEATGSDKRFSFALPATGESRMLCIFESAIDLLSYATMAQTGGLSWRSQHLLSLAGVYKSKKETQERRLPLALTQYLKDHAEIKAICLCLDNDMTGRSATEAIRQQLVERAGAHVCGYITFMQDGFTVQYNERSRTYAVSSDNKAFQPNMGGYSIYARVWTGRTPVPAWNSIWPLNTAVKKAGT